MQDFFCGCLKMKYFPIFLLFSSFAAIVTAQDCLPTKCRSKSSHADICAKISGSEKNVKYDEVLRDSCTMPSGEKGVFAQCCKKNSKGGLLLTTLGAEMNEFPHQAALSMGCGGTIYNKRFIITAAHCVVEDLFGIIIRVKPASDVNVTLGTNIGGHRDFDSKEHVYQVEKIIHHEKYSHLENSPERKKPSDVQGIYNDIALLKLSRDITFGEEVKSLEIAPSNFHPHAFADNVVIVGWGLTDTLTSSQHLQKANLLIRRDTECFVNGPHKTNSERQDQLLCLGGILNKVWSPIAGGGDSGGPAVCRSPTGNAVLCGVCSYGGSKGDPCVLHKNETTCQPVVYVEVSHFRKWIEQHAGKQDPKTFLHAKLYGEVVPRGKFMHQVHITSTNGKPCGGTLISKDVVVTAAHCVLKNDGSLHKLSGLKVTAESKDLKGQGKHFNVGKVVHLKGFERIGTPVEGRNYSRHGYSRIFLADNYHKNDLALVKLDGRVNIDEKHIPVLPHKMISGGELTTEISFPRKVTHGSQLMSRIFNIIEKTLCQKRIDRLTAIGYKDLKVDDNVLCGVEQYSGGSQCDRELGGGLICQGENGKDVLCGVQVFRTCEMAIPNGFVDMGMNKNWVAMEMKKLA